VLLTEPDVEADVRAANEKRLRAFVEQILRVYPPQHYQQRRVIADVTLCGVPLREGDLVTTLFASANRDERHYADPESLDLDPANPRDHMSFSAGPHSCIGQGLARVEVFETVRQVLERFGELRLDEDHRAEIGYRGLTMRGYTPLHVVF